MRRLLGLLVILAVMVAFPSCSKKMDVTAPQKSIAPTARVMDNPARPAHLQPATVARIPAPVPKKVATRTAATAVGATLTPATLSATLRPGECISEHKSLFLPADVQPARLDLIIGMDLTGSMGGELNNVKVNSANIMTALRGLVTDSEFGLMSHMDYPGIFSGCGYSNEYGSAPAPCSDYAYQLNQSVTADMTLVTNAINALALGCGSDGPEDYSRLFFESYSDPAAGWRTGAKRILMQWGDSEPHDCAVDAILGGATTSGPDPGRDAIAGNGDDLQILPVLDGMKTNNVTLISLHSGDLLTLWQAYAAKTGGAAFQINADGTIPGGTDIATFIAGLVGATSKHVDEMKLDVCDPAFKTWLTTVTPASYTDLTLDHDQTLGFDVQICVPAGTAPGHYCFDVCALGDGAEFARQSVCIDVVTTIDVPLDIKPTSCPNPLTPANNAQSVVPVAILGMPGFDVSRIDPESVRLEGVAPIRWAYEDVAAPFMPLTGKHSCSDCTTAGPDGIRDLTLKFNHVALYNALLPLRQNECRVVHMTGMTRDGVPIAGEDVMIVRQVGTSGTMSD